MTTLKIVIQEIDENSKVVEEIVSNECKMVDFKTPNQFLNEISRISIESGNLVKKNTIKILGNKRKRNNKG
jgi:hypothetical protein